MSWPTRYDKKVKKRIAAVPHTNTEVLGGRLEERVLLRLGHLAGSEGGSSGLLAGSGLGFGRLVIETKSAMQVLGRLTMPPRSSSAVSIETDTAQQENASLP